MSTPKLLYKDKTKAARPIIIHPFSNIFTDSDNLLQSLNACDKVLVRFLPFNFSLFDQTIFSSSGINEIKLMFDVFMSFSILLRYSDIYIRDTIHSELGILARALSEILSTFPMCLRSIWEHGINLSYFRRDLVRSHLSLYKEFEDIFKFFTTYSWRKGFSVLASLRGNGLYKMFISKFFNSLGMFVVIWERYLDNWKNQFLNDYYCNNNRFIINFYFFKFDCKFSSLLEIFNKLLYLIKPIHTFYDVNIIAADYLKLEDCVYELDS